MTNQINTDQELIPLRSDERKRLLPIGTTTLYKEINAGRLPAVKIGARTYLRRGDVQRYVENLARVGNA